MNKSLHAFISHLYRAGAQVAVDQFQAWALQELKSLVPFDAAIWGMGNAQRRRFNNVSVFGLPGNYAQALEDTQHLNPIPRHIAKNIGQPVAMEDIWPDRKFYSSELYRQCFERFGVERLLATSYAEPRSGLYTLLTLYRFNRKKPFTVAEREIQQVASYHLIAAYSHVFFLHLTRPKTAQSGRIAAVVDGEGIIHELQHGFLDMLEASFPGWRGQRLPFEVPREEREFNLNGLCIHIRPIADLFLVHIWERGPLDLLTAREREVVQAVCRGLSHKEIGRQMGLAPTTVSSHLYRAYGKLRVESRTALAKLVHG